MALINCPACGTTVDEQARACPSCGRPLSEAAFPPGGAGIANRWSKYWPVGLTIIGALLLAAVIAVTWTAHDQKRDADLAMSPSKAERLQSDAEASFTESLRRAKLGNMMLRQAQLHADSYQLDKATVMADGAICYTYQTRNASGGRDTETAVLSPDEKLSHADQALTQAAWAKFCTQQTGTDVTARVR